jgi:phospholipid/cholesterol/gamma-HCH transport system substrate-binding protein
MIRRSTKVQLAVFALITLLGISYVSARYVGLGDRLLDRGYVVTVDLAESGGIFANAEVTYRGVTIGRVDRLRLARDGVHVDLRLDDAPRVPADTRAVVANRSAVGEQYVDLQPRRRGGPYLADGDRIDERRTQTPLHTETLLLNLDRLVESVDRRDLSTVIDELGRAFAGTGPDLQRLIDSGDALTRAATANLPQTVRLLEDGAPVLDTQRRSGGAIRSFATDLAALSTTLRRSDGDLRKVLDNGVTASRELDALLRANQPALSALLTNLVTTGEVVVARLRGVEQILVTYPVNVAGGYTVVPGDGTAHFGLVLNAADPPACTKGYGGTDQRIPGDTAERPANTAARCAEPRGSRTNVRGAQNSPGSAGPAARAVPGGLALTDVDRTSGLALGPTGSPLLVGSSGGAARSFGKESWRWLLLSPLSR